MILQSIALSGWRCFSEELTVGPLSDRLNIIHGPNGIGKSTLFEALRRGLMDSHAVSGQDILAVRPWGRALSPKIEVMFSHDGVEYRVVKQFIDGARTLLERKEDGAFRALAEGRQADEQTRELLSRNAPGRGLSRACHWGLAQVLWVPQGALSLTELSGDLISDIQGMLGVQVAEKTTGPIQKRIEDKYRFFFTAQGRVKSGQNAPPIVSLNCDLDAAKQRRKEAEAAFCRFEEISRRVEELAAKHLQLSFATEELERQVVKERKRADRYRELKAAFDLKRNAKDMIRAQHDQLDQHLQLIRNTETELEQKKGSLTDLENEKPNREQDVLDKRTAEGAAHATLNSVLQEAEVVEDAEKTAEVARLYLELGNRLKRIEKIQEAERVLADRRQARVAIVAPSANTLRSIREAIQERNTAKTMLDAAMISLEIVPEKSGVIEVLRGETSGTIEVSGGKIVTVKGVPEVAVNLVGVARIATRGPVGDVETYRNAIREKEQVINELTRPFGTSDIGRLEALKESFERADSRVNAAAAELEALLEDDSLETIAQEESEIRAQAEAIEQVNPDWKMEPPDYEVLKRAAGDAKQTHNQREESARLNLGRAQQALQTAETQLQVLLSQLDAQRNSVTTLETYLAELTNDGRSVQDRESDLRQLRLDLDAASESLSLIENELDTFTDDPIAALETMERSLAAAQEDAQQAKRDEVRAMGNLDTLAGQGTYSTLAAADEEASRLETEITRETRRMDAIRLLFQTISDCRQEMVASVARPVEASATRFLQRIAGSRVGRIEMGQGFEPSRVVPALAEDGVDIVNLSGGEQEQLYLATRLALAEVLAQDERQMVVFDDVLTATDAGRLARVLNVLREASSLLQILVLTCHPERYRALDGAHFFNLEEIRNA